MPIPINQLVVDRCYATSTDEVRQLVKIEHGLATYKSAEPTDGKVSWSGLTTIGLSKFAREADREVPAP